MAAEPPAGPEAQDIYLAARSAAEAGRYAAALQGYETVLPTVTRGRKAAELRLEYALILLYADRPDQALAAVAAATRANRSRAIRGRGAILAALAEHGRLDRFLAERPPYIAARDRARKIYNQLLDTYERHAALNEADIIPARLLALRESLAGIELAEMRRDLARGKGLAASQRAQYIQLEFGDTTLARNAAQELVGIARRRPV